MSTSEPQKWTPAYHRDEQIQHGARSLARSISYLSGDIAHFARLARAIVARGEERFFEDSEDGEILRRAGRNLVTEFWVAVERLPEDVVEAHPEIPIENIRGMRNRVAHHYEHVDDEYVWAALDGRFQEVADALAEYRGDM